MARVIVGRLPETIRVTDSLYRQLFGKNMEAEIRGENTTMLGIDVNNQLNVQSYVRYLQGLSRARSPTSVAFSSIAPCPNPREMPGC